MNELTKNNIVLMGLPNAGKTTFLAALWHLVNASEVDCAYSYHSYDGDKAYLNLIRKDWLEVKPLGRTSSTGGAVVGMKLKNKESQEILRISFPDLAGEVFASQWEDRECSYDYVELVKKSSGLILFVNPDDVVEPISILEGNKLMSLAGMQSEEDNENSDDDSDQDLEEVEWKHELSPTQVKLVDILQFALELRKGENVKVAIAISAWDIAGYSDPKLWVAENLPLLQQYLNNANHIRFNCFGVSAQGGTFDQVTKLRDIDVPSERILIKFDGSESNDLTSILKWIMDT